MLKDLLKETKEYILKVPKFITLIFAIWFCRYFYIIILLVNNINTLSTYRRWKWIDINNLFTTIKDWVSTNNIWWIIAILIIFGLWYLIFYPVWLSAWIHFVNDEEKSPSAAFSKWLKDFFLMFEFNWLALSFWEFTYLTTTSRLFAIDILSNNFVLALDLMWWFFVLFASIFWQYSKFILVLEKDKDGKDIWIFKAIRKSMSLAVSNFQYTFKWFISRIIVSILFYFRMLIIVAVPLLIIYFLYTSNIIWQSNQWIITLLIIITMLIATYLFVLVQAFFVKFQYEMYKKVSWK